MKSKRRFLVGIVINLIILLAILYATTVLAGRAKKEQPKNWIEEPSNELMDYKVK
jgi:hypothetical protein